MYKRKKTSLILPAYNEEKAIEKIIKNFQSLNIIDEIIVVNNNSNDNTKRYAKRAGAKVIKEEKQGFGHTLQKGLHEASGAIIILCEPDGTFDAEDTLRLLEHIDTYDVVIGSRTHPDFIDKDSNMGFLIRIGNVLLAKCMQILYASNTLSDCGCTYRIFRKDVIQKILPFLTVGQSHFLPETVILSIFAHKSFIEIPVHYRKRLGYSKITGSLKRAMYVGTMMLFLILDYRIKRSFGFKID
ncbi:MAG: hypothetical protein A3F31_05105 [Candidatus Levybacteria bacterium RIFCSPHIGHO2_12_FULL_38_12]|nr:MAG: hypothetical protein A2770_00300 [Candidatus Levybacteria bacterium RIFCSPHIGHO2_01_FULL_38_12]OGH21712.1 MAG: hypothetical protein A3D75_00800 [Candidatus Levybacteria bacterium RIFCSPHIGHO2_02_FULL_37_18]OGH22630.1 MAG: hypothetical protein A3F31_05105 [Candidatus Levybacteria bacterium RIFCSPHIGHO2_12_FULL_38_12]OGH33333.1 MAG: hypothetical protein A3A47_03750 [Candidatus Levybacteria bacterium RIFCSPLOWO2_01_FULL_37_20]OGH43722.1 MAG: hypothetical protein A3J14_04300 [Candidatus Lev